MIDARRWNAVARRVLLAACLLPLLATAQAQGPTTRYVNHADPTCGGHAPCYTTIQAAITAAQAGDTVLIQPGTYAEQLSITGKNSGAGTTEADRITIAADPAEPAGSVVLTGTVSQCTNGHAVRFQQSKFVTLRGLTITGAGGQAIALLGGNNQNRAIHLEGLRIFDNGSASCHGGITINSGNPETLIANSLIYGNGRNGITFLDADGGPNWLIGNTIHGNAWSGINVARSHDVLLVNNLITGNGTETGSTGGRFGVTREGSSSPEPAGLRLLHNVICGNRLGEIAGPTLDSTDAGNLTPTGAEGPGVLASPGCELPATVYANLVGADGVANTGDDDFTLAGGSPAVDAGIDPRTLGLNAAFTPILESDFFGAAARPRAGTPGGAALFDAGAVERLGEDTTAPAVAFTQPAANAFVRQTVTVEAQASDAGGVASLGLIAGPTTLAPTFTPALPAPTVTATAAWDTTGVLDGVYTLFATATDQAGHTTNTTRVVTVDNTPPDTQILGGPTGPTAETTVTFTFTGTDNVSQTANLQFAWRLDGGAFTAFGSATSATLTGLTEGPHTFEVKARDQATNEDPSPASASLTVTFAPMITALEPASGPIGTLVTIRGLNFAATPAGNIVGFAGTVAVVRTATPTALTTTVPPAAITGPVTVTTAQGVATSPMPFTVTTTQEFGLTVLPGVASVLPTATTSYTVELPSTGSETFTGLAMLTVDGAPAGTTATFDRPALSGGQRATLTVAATATASPATATLTIRATAPSPSGPVTRTATATLAVEGPGQTALVGRILVVDGTPIVGARLTLDTQMTTTDAAGNFVLLDPPVGTHPLSIDTNIARPGFPMYAVDVTLAAGQVTTLPAFLITPPPPPERFVPIANATATQVVTDARYPGLSITLPAGVTITGWDGVQKDRIALERLSPDRLPVPPPPGETRSLYQVYFGTPMGGLPSAPLPVTLPNDQNAEPGEPVELWYYDAAPFGGMPAAWRLAGLGTVSEDGTRVTSNPGVGIERFCGVCGLICMILFQGATPNRNPGAPTPGQGPGSNPGPGPRPGPQGPPRDGEPVDLALGQQIVETTDVFLPGRIPAIVHRTYNPFDAFGHISGFQLSLGRGWALSIDVAILEVNGLVRRIVLPGNARFDFVSTGDGRFVNATHPRWGGAVLSATAGGRHELRHKDGSIWRFGSGWIPLGAGFPVAGLGLLVEQIDRVGNSLIITRAQWGAVSAITQPGGRRLEVTLNGTTGLAATVRDPLGRTIQYGYDTAGRLSTVTDQAGGLTRYTYTSAGGIVTITNPRGAPMLTHEYDARGRVSRQIAADGSAWSIQYDGPVGAHTAATVKDPAGHTTMYRMSPGGFVAAMRDAVGLLTHFDRDARNQVVASVDESGRLTRAEHDELGNVTRLIDSRGHARVFTYDLPFSQLTSIDDPIRGTTRFEYDSVGNMTAQIEAAGARTTLVYDASGQLTQTTDALGNTARFDYNGVGDRVATIDALGNVTRREYDAASRLIAEVDPTGAATTFTYDSLDRPMTVSDPHGNVTRFSYDANGNVLTITDPLGRVTTYNYDSMDRLTSRIDAAGGVELLEYDAIGNVIRTTDRKGQSVSFFYDHMDRLVRASYADGNIANFTYDVTGALVRADESLGRAVVNTYDGAGRLTSQITEAGTVVYHYDVAGRRIRFDAPGQLSVLYEYDEASRPTRLTQGSQVVTLEFDAVGRRARLVLPNQVATEYGYDPASRLTSVVYRNAQGLLGDLTYQYDAAGNRIRIGGSLARLLLPETVMTGSYDALNRQVALGDRAVAYDGNGNLMTIAEPSGTTTFTWDVRNRLVGVSGQGSTMAAEYDPLGRRVAREIDGQLTLYMYDGDNITQEFRENALTSYLGSLEVDEVFSRDGRDFYLVDALGSVVGLTDLSGAFATRYAYEAFGRTTQEGDPASNTLRYAGREHDGTGLYYYRARYYHPELSRFLSEDPLRETGGLNYYAYAGR